MRSHVRERKGVTGALPARVFAGGAEKDVSLAFNFGWGIAFEVQLDFVEGRGAVDLVLGDEVDLAFALAVPPAAESGEAPGLCQFGGEIPFEGESAENAPVASDERTQLVECAELDRCTVSGDKTEPEVVEVVADHVAKVLSERLGEDRLSSHDDLVVLLQPLEIAAERTCADGVLNLTAFSQAPGDGGEDGKVDAVVFAEFLDERVLALFHEDRSVAGHGVDHLVGRDRTAVHQHGDIFGNAAGDCIKGEKVGCGEAGIVGFEDLLQGRDGKGPDPEKCARSTEQRLLVVSEDAVHQGVRAAADDQIDLCAGLVLVPVPLHFTEDGGVAALEVLEFVDHQRERMLARVVENPFENVPEMALLAGQEDVELASDLSLKGRAKLLFAPPRNEEVEVIRSVFKRLADQFRLPDAAASRHHGELRGLVRSRTDVPQNADLLCPSEEFHRLPSLNRNRRCRNRRSCLRESISNRDSRGQGGGIASRVCSAFGDNAYRFGTKEAMAWFCHKRGADRLFGNFQREFVR